jgi:hypothetical protein
VSTWLPEGSVLPPIARRRDVEVVLLTLMGQLVEPANGPVITGPLPPEPLPPIRSAVNGALTVERSTVQSQYGTVTVESYTCKAFSNSIRYCRCHGRKDGPWWA